MAIDPKLLFIKPVNELESVTGLQAGELLFYDTNDPDVPLKKISIDTFNNLSKTAKPIIPDGPSPTEEGLYIPTYASTYPNAGGLVANDGYFTLFFFDGTNWTKSESKYPDASNNIRIWNYQNFLESEQCIKDFNYYIAPNGANSSDIPGESDKWVLIGSKIIGTKPISSSKFDIKDVDDLTKVEGSIIAPNGQFVNDPIGLHKFIALKKDTAVSIGYQPIQGTAPYVIVYDDNTIGSGVLRPNHELDFIYFFVEKDCTLYLNQNTGFEEVPIFDVFRKIDEEKTDLQDYVDFKTGEMVYGNPINIPFSDIRPGVIFPMHIAQIGVTTYTEAGVQGGYAVSQLIPVTAGDKVLVSGFFGEVNGVALFNENGIFIEKLLTGSNIQYTDVELNIKQNGFIHSSSLESAVNGFKVFNREIENKIEDDGVYSKILQISRPKFARLDFYGTFPTDETDARTPTELDFDFTENGHRIFSAKCELSIQGHGSATLPKKGFSFDLFNMNGDALKLKIGDLIATDGFHLKAYQTDRTHTRDVALGRIWRDIIHKNPFPINQVNNRPFNLEKTAENDLFVSDAKYRTDGVPVEIYLNNSFYGLFTLRLKKTRENYAMISNNKSQIFLDSYDYEAYLNNGFVPSKWEVKNPKISGYVAGESIGDATVNASVQRFFNWMKAFVNNTGSARADYAQYIVLNNWIDYCIFVESVDHVDSVANNTNLLTWDNVHWNFCPYDMDNSIGLSPADGFILLVNKQGFVLSDIWSSFREVFNNQIKQRYTELRQSGFLTAGNMGKYFDEISENIPRNVQQKDKEVWNNIWNNGYPSVYHIKTFLNNRLTWLDSQWLN